MMLIKDIIEGRNLDAISRELLNSLYTNGPILTSDLELLSYFKRYQPTYFSSIEKTVLQYSALFFKENAVDSLKDLVMKTFHDVILDKYHENYTPVQASLCNCINDNQFFSFSAPTSTGKSFFFMKMIEQCEGDVLVVVPSRALINEYYMKLCSAIPDKSVSILTFIDKINTDRTRKNIFVVTPERCREIFRQKDLFSIQLILFDEAQLGDEEGTRGVFFDGIIRRLQRAYPSAKYVFAHPFVKNPDAQIKKNFFNLNSSKSVQYQQKNVGQMFVCYENDKFYHFASDIKVTGRRYIECDRDPLIDVINANGAILFYVSKTCITSKRFKNEYKKYIDQCIAKGKVNGADSFIERLKEYIGGSVDENANGFSLMMNLLEYGIIIHHGSLPLYVRSIIEDFVRQGGCRICFATSTLEQGVNMPFDAVLLGKLEGSKPLSVKNIIGRAGRSTSESKFDYGVVLVKKSRVNPFRNILKKDEVLKETSILDDKDIDEDLIEYRDAVKDGSLSDEYNLTDKTLTVLKENSVEQIIFDIINCVVIGNDFISENFDTKSVSDALVKIYELHLKRLLNEAEKGILETSIKILLWKIKGRTFKNICWQRYSYISQLPLRRQGLDVEARFMYGYADLPNSRLNSFSLFPPGTKAKDVDYDQVVADTYDYLDKLLGNKVLDVFYAAFQLFYEKTKDNRARVMALYFKYCTANEKHIMLLRYGLSFEDIDYLDKYIIDVNQQRMVIDPDVMQLPEEKRKCLERYM